MRGSMRMVSFLHKLETWETMLEIDWFHFYISLKWRKIVLEISLHAPNIMTQVEVHAPQDSFYEPK